MPRRFVRHRRLLAAAVCPMVLVACTGDITSTGVPGTMVVNPAPVGPAPSATDRGPKAAPAACATGNPLDSLGPPLLRRLTRSEYQGSISALFGLDVSSTSL